MCKYCDANELQKVYDTIDKMNSNEIDYDYYCDHEDEFLDLFESHSVMTTYDFGCNTYRYLDGRSYSDGDLSTWDNDIFKYCPACGRKLN